MNRTMRAESGAEVAKEDVWDQVSALVGRFGHAAEQYAARFDFGISPEVIRGRMEPILGDARRSRLDGPRSRPTLRPMPPPDDRFRGLDERTRRRAGELHGTGAGWP